MASTPTREQVADFIERELVGPAPGHPAQQLNGEEILRPQDPPRLRYSAGVLFPEKTAATAAERATDDEAGAADGAEPPGSDTERVELAEAHADEIEEPSDNEVNRTNEYLPSALGLTALVRVETALWITVSGARYRRESVRGLGREIEGRFPPHYFRVPFSQRMEVPANRIAGDATVITDLFVDVGDPNRKLQLHVFSRPHPKATGDRDRIVTFTLINRNRDDDEGAVDDLCYFQCRLEVTTEGAAPGFLPYPEAPAIASLTNEERAEEASLALLYRKRTTHAIGHGCAADWDHRDGQPTGRIWTVVLPRYEVHPIVATEDPNMPMSMSSLCRNAGRDAVVICRKLADAYESWIVKKEAEVDEAGFPDVHQDSARDHLAKCRSCLERMREGIQLLGSDPVVLSAFARMNDAMIDQQLHYLVATEKRREWTVSGAGKLEITTYVPPDKAVEGAKRNWRPFQLAFILMNLGSASDAEHPHREMVDLIWFPTGGGKTEAYLGLTAFTIFLRRLRNPTDIGTTVLMRYTLRLLTTQQFQRAASLICACEVMRQKEPQLLGKTPISIGLWVGNTVTPGKHTDALAKLSTLLNEGKPNPFVVLTCPWCGAQMGPVQAGNSYRTPGYAKEGGRVVFRCADAKCDFNAGAGLPMHVVDDAIYDECPTLVIGTVDKFAMLPWNVSARRLFGLGHVADLSPPELIIQDELHLISGALGSMVGLYEGTIESLCRGRSVDARFRPKIVASTATICRAPDQIRKLYARPSFLFPPQGLDAGDSFFAREDRDQRGRLYIGVMGTAVGSHITAQIRTVSALLQAPKMVVSTAKGLDPYWSLVAYFNSLRELGHAASLVRADIREYMNAMWDRLGIAAERAGRPTVERRRFINHDLELTSRIQSSEVTHVLQRLFEEFTEAVDEKGKSLNRAVDVCLATNMIQVGLDVPRLGLMAVIGQPKTTSEYIQATSRVGRSKSGPGLVTVIYSPGKPRDRSHYEHFISYHRSAYRWVEPTSVTPYSIPVRERALLAQLVTLVRFWGEESVRDRPQPAPPEALIERIVAGILDRALQVDESEHEGTRSMLEELVRDWRRLTPAAYGGFGPPTETAPLMFPAGTQPAPSWAGRSRATPSSMRNVDAGCGAGVLAQYPTD